MRTEGAIAHKPSVVSFDGDNTLWDLDSTMRNALTESAKAFANAGLTLGGAPVTAAWLKSVRDDIASSAGHESVSMEEVRRTAFLKSVSLCGSSNAIFANSVYESYMAARFDRLIFYCDSRIALQQLKSLGFKLALITNGNTSPCRVGLDGVFDISILSFDVGYRKPDPAIYRHASHVLGIAVRDWLHIGDDWQEDVVSARHAGMQAAWLQRGQDAYQSVTG